MASSRQDTPRYWIAGAILSLVVIALALLVAGQNHRDLLRLSVEQGSDLVESLSQVLLTEQATVVDRQRTAERDRRQFARLLWDQLPRSGGAAMATAIAGLRGTSQIATMSPDSLLHVVLNDEREPLPDIVRHAAQELLTRPDTNFFTIPVQHQHGQFVYYLERSNSGRDVLIICEPDDPEPDAFGLAEWSRRLEEDSTILFISWETPREILLSSAGYVPADSTAQLLIAAAGKGEEILSLRVRSSDGDRLELFRPFPTLVHPLGVFRVALPLSTYEEAVSRADRQVLVSAVLALTAVIGGLTGFALFRRRRAEAEALRSLRGLFGSVLNSLELGVLVTDAREVVQIRNEWLGRNLGIAVAEGKPYRDGGSAEALRDILSHADEIRPVLRSDGTQAWLQATSVPLSVATGEEWRLTFIHDRTAQQEIEERLQRQSRVAELGELAAGVAHDIRNPLHTISLGLQQLLASRPGEHLATEELVALLREEVSRINQSISRFLSLTRGRELQQQKIDLSELLEKRIQVWSMRARTEGKQLTWAGITPFFVVSDRGRLDDILDNLLRNAFEATISGSGCIRLSCAADTAHWRLIVDDNGPGIQEGAVSKIFSPGYTTKEGGTGIGLSLVQKLVRELDGEISVGRSELGGACLTLVFPVVVRQTWPQPS